MEKDYLTLLKGSNYQEVPCKKNDKTNTLTLGYYIYAPHIDEIIKQVVGDEIITDYNQRIRDIQQKEISSLDMQEVKTYFTFINRGERFCDGHIAKFLDNGIFIKLYERYLELC